MRGDEPLPGTGLALFLAQGALLAAEPVPPAVGDPWLRAAAALVHRNAETLALLALTRDRLLPAPISPVGLRPAELLALARARGHDLVQARRRYRRRTTCTALMLVERETKGLAGREVRALCRSGLEQGGAALPRLHRRLALLDPETPARERATVLEVAARAVTTTSPAAAASYADRLAAAVRTANEATRRRRAGAELAACYLQVLTVAPAEPAAGWIAGRLVAVLGGDCGLTPRLHDDAERWRSRFEEAVERACAVPALAPC
ncbi:hypothetical protein [Actinomadura fibrosa]|uniref:Uncharacterized protein n=1 Tax=Actinomadura fibrosa TaxID=111802 RepID=A0ABW2XEU1_9ACTN|nr:hypothetical protein [Actinomadura fibrosa]